ncbi:MAG: virulence factor [Hyphomicrobiales bacterium]|nr:virulence factor [Hyphomicrobiales bacterium]
MFAIAFDLSIADAQRHHPRSSRQAYLDIEKTLAEFGFERVQWSVFAAQNEDLANLFRAIDALRRLDWFGKSVKNIRAFRMEQGSDLTAIVKRNE